MWVLYWISLLDLVKIEGKKYIIHIFLTPVYTYINMLVCYFEMFVNLNIHVCPFKLLQIFHNNSGILRFYDCEMFSAGSICCVLIQCIAFTDVTCYYILVCHKIGPQLPFNFGFSQDWAQINIINIFLTPVYILNFLN